MNVALRALLGRAYMIRNDHQGITVYFQLASPDEVFCDWVASEQSERITDADMHPGVTGPKTLV